MKRFYCPRCKKFKSRIQVYDSDWELGCWCRYCCTKVVDVHKFFENLFIKCIEEDSRC